MKMDTVKLSTKYAPPKSNFMVFIYFLCGDISPHENGYREVKHEICNAINVALRLFQYLNLSDVELTSVKKYCWFTEYMKYSKPPSKPVVLYYY